MILNICSCSTLVRWWWLIFFPSDCQKRLKMLTHEKGWSLVILLVNFHYVSLKINVYNPLNINGHIFFNAIRFPLNGCVFVICCWILIFLHIVLYKTWHISPHHNANAICFNMIYFWVLCRCCSAYDVETLVIHTLL